MFSASAELYDAIYGTFKDYATEADAIAELIRATHPNTRTILDVACGTGEHARHLRLRHGFSVDGIDLDAGLLAIARRKVADAHFVVADMAAFDLARGYDVVACMFSSIGYLKTIARVTEALVCFRRHLNPQGIVILEPWFQPGVLRVGSGATRSVQVDELRVERTSDTAVAGRLSTVTFTYHIESASGAQTAREVHELGLFTVDEMLGSFRDAGLVATHDPVGLSDGRGLYIARATA